MIIQDVQAGKGLCVVDPHGDLVEGVLPHVPKERADDIVLFEPFDLDRPMGLNMLEFKSEDQKDFAVQEMINIFYKLFPPEMIGPMFEHNMRNVMLTLMADQKNPGTIAEIPRMFTDQDYQKKWVAKLKDPVVRSFWENEMAKTSDFHKSEMLGYLISKVGRFVENEMMRNIMGQSHSAFDLRDIMDNEKVLLVNLSKGKTGEVNSELLGLIIVSKIQMAAMARADMPEEERKDFYLYVDEFQNFATDSFASILAEARKYRLNLIVAHQYVTQLEENIRDAVFGNVGSFFTFRIGVEDAEIIAKEFDPVFSETDVINIERFHTYLRLMTNSQKSNPFTMATYPPYEGGSEEIAQAVKQLSRLKFGRDRKVVETEIMSRAQLGAQVATQPPAERTA
jgi:type IV secretory pathway TraG/TraD family ATPase VirD4